MSLAYRQHFASNDEPDAKRARATLTIDLPFGSSVRFDVSHNASSKVPVKVDKIPVEVDETKVEFPVKVEAKVEVPVKVDEMEDEESSDNVETEECDSDENDENDVDELIEVVIDGTVKLVPYLYHIPLKSQKIFLSPGTEEDVELTVKKPALYAFVDDIRHDLPDDHPVKGEYLWGCNSDINSDSTDIESVLSVGDMILIKVESLVFGPPKVFKYCCFIKSVVETEEIFWAYGPRPPCDVWFAVTKPFEVDVTYETLRSKGVLPGKQATLLEVDETGERYQAYVRSQSQKKPRRKIFTNRRDKVWHAVCSSHAMMRDGAIFLDRIYPDTAML